MEEIKVGDYVRTIYGEIAKITQVHPRIKGIKRKAQGLIDFNLIKKHSKNIIDLIEVGDYVNNCYVLHTAEELPREQVNGKNRKCISINTDRDINNKFGWKLLDLEIREILTKEQYMQNCYKLDKK